jgi:hypothetical protein
MKSPSCRPDCRRLEEIDVNELARMTTSWVQNVDPAMSRRALLLKLSAALSLAAASPDLADDDSGALPQTVPHPPGLIWAEFGTAGTSITAAVAR